MAYQKIFTLSEDKRVNSNLIDWYSPVNMEGIRLFVTLVEAQYLSLFPDAGRAAINQGGEMAFAPAIPASPTQPYYWFVNEASGTQLGLHTGTGYPEFADRHQIAAWFNDHSTQMTPTGSIVAFGGTAAPSGWRLCDGGAISRTTFAALFAVIGTAYGVGDGSTTFNVPDLRQRFPLGKAAAGTGSTLGGTGGAIDHVHSVSGNTGTVSADHVHGVNGNTGTESANHTHGVNINSGTMSAVAAVTPGGAQNGGDHVHNVNGNTGGISVNHSHGISFNTGGISANHTHGISFNSGTNNPPFQVVNYIIAI